MVPRGLLCNLIKGESLLNVTPLHECSIDQSCRRSFLTRAGHGGGARRGSGYERPNKCRYAAETLIACVRVPNKGQGLVVFFFFTILINFCRLLTRVTVM